MSQTPEKTFQVAKVEKKTLNLFEWTSYKYVCCLLQIVTETSIRVAIEMLLLSKHRYSSNYTELLACWYGTLFVLILCSGAKLESCWIWRHEFHCHVHLTLLLQLHGQGHRTDEGS